MGYWRWHGWTELTNCIYTVRIEACWLMPGLQGGPVIVQTFGAQFQYTQFEAVSAISKEYVNLKFATSIRQMFHMIELRIPGWISASYTDIKTGD